MIKDIISTAEADKSFYPTPKTLAEKLLAGIEWDCINSVLEPSAGKGDLVGAAAEKNAACSVCKHKINIDCIEIDPYLRSVLQYEFQVQHLAEIRDRLKALSDKQTWDYRTGVRGKLTETEAEEEKALELEYRKRENLECHIVHDNFLTFKSCKRYQLIVMNPPFANGDEHLLKAIDLLSGYGGQIRCLLNAETIRNPCTNRRELLKKRLTELGAEISFVDNAFAASERRTNVAAAIIKIDLPEPRRESRIFEGLRRAARLEDISVDDISSLTVQDFLGRIVSLFDVETAAGIELIHEYLAMRPYIMRDFSKERSRYTGASLTLCVGKKEAGTEPDINNYLLLTRMKYWRALFSSKDFLSRLTSNLREEYQGAVERMADYDFTLFNIRRLNIEMNARMQQGIKDTIVALFDRLTQEHSWYPECARNIHYYNGWQTNKAHKINNKVILPVCGIFADYSWAKTKTFDVYRAESVISDIEKVFDYLDGNMTAPVNLQGVLQRACDAGQTRNIPCKYFDVTLYKKGTMHIKFHNRELIDRFNIYYSRHKNWLPPGYGKVQYGDMNDKERAVVDGFHGDGSQGAGEQAYSRVIAHAAYYLAEPAAEIPLLSTGEDYKISD